MTKADDNRREEDHSDVNQSEHSPGPWEAIKNVNWPLNTIGQYPNLLGIFFRVFQT